MARKAYRKDDRVWKQMKKNLRSGKSMINVGWFEGDEHRGDTMTIPTAQIAKWVEEGHINGGMFAGTITPPRPILRGGFIDSIPRDRHIWGRNLNVLIDSVAKGKITWGQLHKIIAPTFVDFLQQNITTYNTRPNTSTTVELKGFNKPWIHTGQLKDQVNYKIVDWKMYPSSPYMIRG